MYHTRSHFFRKFQIFSLTVLTITTLVPAAARAEGGLPIRDTKYTAQYMGQSIPDPITIEAGKTTQVVFQFKNVGEATWEKTGSRYVSAYTDKLRGRASLFHGKNWETNKQTGTIKKQTKPGAIAEIVIDIQAPVIPGIYTEYFHLAADGHTWIKGGSFFIKFTVMPNKTASEVLVPVTQGPSVVKKVAQSVDRITAEGGEKVEVRVTFMNKSTTVWREYAFFANAPVALASLQKLSFADTSWQSSSVIVAKEEPVTPNDFVQQNIIFRAPALAGEYTARFTLQVDGRLQNEAEVVVPITVTANAPEEYMPPVFSEPVITYRLSKEPVIRVGVWRDPVGLVTFVSSEDEYTIKNSDMVFGILPKDVRATFTWNGAVYSVRAEGIDFSSALPFRLEPVNDPHAVFILPTFTRTISWKGSKNFNMYRGVFEFRSTEKGAVYGINEVYLEDYIAGIGETSNGAAMEYHKALLTAARSYAYHAMASTKHDSRFFDVVATTGDQLYLGYESERMLPRVVEAARATRGAMIIFQGEVVVTPYYGNSDGRTRAYTEVWGGAPKPWLQPVIATYDARDGKKMFGHGVGMSQRDAAYRAEEEGLGWEALVKYYYRGVAVERLYE